MLIRRKLHCDVLIAVDQLFFINRSVYSIRLNFELRNFRADDVNPVVLVKLENR